MHRGAKGARSYTFRNHHCGGGAYGATGATGAPYVTGAVAQGLQTGAGGGHAGAQGARRWQSQLQQPQPALLTAKTRIATRSDVLFMIVSPYLRGTSVDSNTARAHGQFAAASAGSHVAKLAFNHSSPPVRCKSNT